MFEISQLVKYSNKAYEKEFVSATDGNLSVRLDKNRIAIARSGINKGDVTENDIIIIDNNGNKLEGNGKASSEAKIHLLAYNNRNDINSVVHCHPIYATAFATAGFDLADPIFPEVILTIGPIHLCKYATPSTEELPNSMKPYIGNSWALLLQNHGAVTFGNDITSAFHRMEKLEHASKTLFMTKLLGGENILRNEEVQKLYSIAEETYEINLLGKFGRLNQNNSSKLGFNSSEKNYSEIIDARLRARAGNPKVNFVKKGQQSNLKNKPSELIQKIIKDFSS